MGMLWGNQMRSSSEQHLQSQLGASLLQQPYPGSSSAMAEGWDLLAPRQSQGQLPRPGPGAHGAYISSWCLATAPLLCAGQVLVRCHASA